MIGSGPDTFSWRTDFPPSPGHIILEADSISCPVGQNFLGKCVPPDTSAWRTDFPPTPELYDIRDLVQHSSRQGKQLYNYVPTRIGRVTMWATLHT